MTDKPKKCSICGKSYTGFGNNAEPVNAGQCCDKCNLEVVIPRRLSIAGSWLRSIPSEKRAQASRENGKKGGRPTNAERIKALDSMGVRHSDIARKLKVSRQYVYMVINGISKSEGNH